jgi:hypothetical protein
MIVVGEVLLSIVLHAQRDLESCLVLTRAVGVDQSQSVSLTKVNLGCQSVVGGRRRRISQGQQREGKLS